MFESKTFAVVGLVSPAAPEISFPSALVVFSLSVSSELNLLSQGGKSYGVFSEQDPLLSLSAKITLISFPSALVVFSLSVSSELNLLSQGGKSSIGTCVHVQSMYWSEVIGIACTLLGRARLASAQFIC